MAQAVALAVTKKTPPGKTRTGKQSVRIGTKCWQMVLDPDAWCNIIGFTKKRRKNGQPGRWSTKIQRAWVTVIFQEEVERMADG